MARFSVAIANRETNIHSACFEEVAKALSESLKELDHDVVPLGDGGRLILFGANNMSPGDMPKDAIIFNTEQVGSGTGVLAQMKSVEAYRERGQVIWDYSKKNIEALRAAGVEKVVHCPIGYHRSMTSFEPVDEADIDVLFYGSLNERRSQILRELNDAGLKVVHLFGVYGKVRDSAIARSKIVLNLHFYPKPIFEIFRVSHLLANKACVVTEDGGVDEELEEFAKRAVVAYVSPQSLVKTCTRLARSGDWGLESRSVRGALGFVTFCQMSFVNNVRQALEHS